MMKASPLLFCGLALVLSAATASATDYAGNGNAGFNGAVGNGVLSITSTATNINFTFSPGATFNSNDLVIYIDSKTGGANSTSTYTDNADGGRTAISGLSGSGRTLATFASGFGADFAVSFEPPPSGGSGGGNFAGLFNLSTPTNFGFVSSGNLATDGNGISTFSFLRSDLGLSTGGGSFTFEATLISTSGYRSNETIGTSITAVDPNNTGTAPNAGFTGTTTFSTASAFTVPAVPAPEPGTWACVGFGAVALLAFGRARTRRA